MLITSLCIQDIKTKDLECYKKFFLFGITVLCRLYLNVLNVRYSIKCSLNIQMYMYLTTMEFSLIVLFCFVAQPLMSFKTRCFYFLQSEVPKTAALTNRGQTGKIPTYTLISFPVCCEEYLLYPNRNLGPYITIWILK